MLVLPPQNNILPKEYLYYMHDDDSPIKYMFPRLFELNIIAGEKFIYSEPILPLIDDIKVINYIKKIRLTNEEKKRNVLNNKVFYYISNYNS